MIVLYDDRCSPCVRKEQWRKLKQIAHRNNDSLGRLDIRKDQSAADFVKSLDIPVPMVWNGSTAIALNEYLDRY